ncbi:hypothetical protein HYY74_02795 [Candidatus Woesearchaeota archaeon]|nr:hypothetical protein [Candidatus Woesearchaeota archaeon]
MGFITVNGRMLDYAEYRRQAKAVEAEALREIEEVLSKYGFRVEGDGKTFVHDRLNLAVSLEIRHMNYE